MTMPRFILSCTHFSRTRIKCKLMAKYRVGYQIIKMIMLYLLQHAVTMSCPVIPASGRLVDVDILELSESPCSGVDIFCTSMGLGRQMAKELDLKLTLGLTERR